MGNRTCNHPALVNAFGLTDEGLPDTPEKIGNVRAARVLHGDERGCSFCFPHGCETTNSRWDKDLRCWKRYRKTQYRSMTKA